MLIEMILALFIGIIAGTFTGLIPGIHINLIGAFIITLFTGILSPIPPIHLIVFITAMAITHTFIDFIPSIFLNCPDTDTELSILPGHQLLKKGQGYEAIILTAYGSLAAIILLILIAFPSITIIKTTYEIIKGLIPFLLILVSYLLIIYEQKKILATIVFFLTGFLGIAVFQTQMQNPLLPLLSGLFGASMLIISIRTKTKIPKQQIQEKIKIKFLKPMLGALIASPLCSFLPGLGSGQAAIIGNSIAKTDTRGFLFLLGATNTLVMGFSFIALYCISRTRTGAAVAIKEIKGCPETNILILILIIILITGIIAFFLTKNIAKIASTKISKINYENLSIFTLFFLAIIVTIFSGFQGLLILIITTLTGIYCISLGVRRTNMMGCLLIPTILLYLSLL